MAPNVPGLINLLRLPKLRQPLKNTSLLMGFLRSLGQRSYSVWYNKSSSVGGFLRWLERRKIPLTELTAGHLHRYLASRKNRGLGRETLWRILGDLRHFCRYAYEQNMIPKVDAQAVAVAWLDMPGGYLSCQSALKEFLSRPEAILRYEQLPFASELEEYFKALWTRSYGKRQHERLASNLRFQQYLIARGKTKLLEVTARDVENFLRTQKKKKRPRGIDSMRASIKGFLRHAFSQRGLEFEPPTQEQDQTAMGKSLADYLDFMSIHRGLRSASLTTHRRCLKQFRSFLARRKVHAPRDVTLPLVDAFIRYKARTCSARTLNGINSILRSFFRYLNLGGLDDFDLADKLYRPSHFSADLRPKYLPWSKIQELLASVKRDTPRGKREYAILTLLASYGLRRREIIPLRLSDLDFENHKLFIRERKGGKPASFPMLPAASAALREYLAIRPHGQFEEVFLTLRHPFRPMSPVTFGRLLRECWGRHFGKLRPTQGAYLVRHSFAKAMLDRGAPLTDIGAILGHQSLNSTLIYTRIATEDLRQVADNYGNLLP